MSSSRSSIHPVMMGSCQIFKKFSNTKTVRYFIQTVATDRQMNLEDDKGFTGKEDKNSRVQLHVWWPDLVRQMLQFVERSCFSL